MNGKVPHRRFIPERQYKFGAVTLGLIRWAFEPDTITQKGDLVYYSPRYKKWLTIPDGFTCDGATCAPNLGNGWRFHDWGFSHGKWDDGTTLTFRQINAVMLDIMTAEGFPKFVRRIYWRGIQSKYSRSAWDKHRASNS